MKIAESIYGTCVQIDAEQKTATFRLLSTQKIIVHMLQQDIYDQLQARMGQTIELEGEVIRRGQQEEPLEFNAESIGPYKNSGALTALDNLAKASGTRWDTVDPEQYVRDLYGG